MPPSGSASTAARIVVVGGGLAGALLVTALLEQGVSEIAWFDAAAPTAGSNVPCALVHPFAGRSFEPRPAVFDAWEAALAWLDALPPEASVHRAPLHRVVHDDETGRRLVASLERHRPAIEDRLGKGFFGEVRPEAIVYGPVRAFDPGRAVRALRRMASASGVESRGGSVARVDRAGSGWRVATGDGSDVVAPDVVIAAGAGTRRLLAPHARVSLEHYEGTLAHAAAPALDRFVVNRGHVASTTRTVAWGSGYRALDQSGPPPAAASPDPLTDIEGRLEAAGARLPGAGRRIWTGLRVVHRSRRLPWVQTLDDGLHVLSAFGSQGGLSIPAAVAHFVGQWNRSGRVAPWPPSGTSSKT